MIIASVIMSIIYAVVIIWFGYAAKTLPLFDNHSVFPEVKFAIIIPYRNEETHLSKLFKSLENIDYLVENFQVFLVNDASTDCSEKLAQDFSKKTHLNVTCLSQKNKSTSPKKEAIELAINEAKFDWILTTDADCILPKFWLKTISDFINTRETNMVVMPVYLTSIKQSYLEAIEMCALQIITMGSFGLQKPIMNNGANLAFSKKSFLEQHGYANHKTTASGDDLFLLENFLKKNEKVTYLKSKNTIVKTTPQSSYSSYIQQRIRWASKSTKSKSVLLKLLGLLVAFTNGLLLVTFIYGLTTFYVYPFLIVYGIKTIADAYIIQEGEQFFKNPLKIHLIWANLPYAILSFYIFLSSLTGGYVWKGRYFKR